MKKLLKKTILDILKWEAKAVLKKYKPKIVTVTGSVGKTSTKEAIFTVLSSTYSVRKSEKNSNSDVGILLTILGAASSTGGTLMWIKHIFEGLSLIILPFAYPKWLVIEVAADPDNIRHISKLSEWLKTDAAVFTAFAKTPVHIEYFNTREKLLEEKLSLINCLKPEGMLILNYDQPEFSALKEDSKLDARTFGFGMGADVRAGSQSIVYGTYDNSEISFPKGISFDINFSGAEYSLVLYGVLGKQHIYPLLAAFAVGSAQKISPALICTALAGHIPPKGRMNLIEGIKDTLIIDDSYNSSPVAVFEGLKVLKELETPGRKIAVLGDMMELGEHSLEEHKISAGRAIDASDILVTVGIRSRGTAEEALDKGMDENNIFEFDTSQETGKYMETILKQGDVVFVKGSQAMRMERVVEEIMKHPENKSALLARQEKRWLAER